MKVFSYEDIESATNCFALDRLIGKGSHGSVYKCVLLQHDQQLIVAVKRPSRSSDNHEKLKNEIEILSSIKLHGIVNLIGVVSNDSKLLITEFMPNGSLHHLLHNSQKPLGWPMRVAMALQIADAILRLHQATPPVIHRDIKSANILLDGKWEPRISDFSLAVRLTDSMQCSMIPAGTLGYLDPCYTESGMLSPRNDVFSFGVVLLELISCRKAMDIDCDPTSIVAWAMPMIQAHEHSKVCDRRVALPNCMKKQVFCVLDIASKCVSEEVESRPLMVDVVRGLRGAARGMAWTIWCSLRNRVAMKVQRCVRTWRRCAKKRVTNTMTSPSKVVYKDDLVGGHDIELENRDPSKTLKS